MLFTSLLKMQYVQCLKQPQINLSLQINLNILRYIQKL